MKVDTLRMTAAADEASALLKTLANRHRLLILCQLVQKERSVGEIAQALAVRSSTASQHLAVLRRDGLVATRRSGQTIWYSVIDTAARAVVETLYHAYCSRPDVRRGGAARRRSSPRAR